MKFDITEVLLCIAIWPAVYWFSTTFPLLASFTVAGLLLDF
jgi:hypothetical protein